MHNLPTEEELYWLELSLTPGVGVRRIRELSLAYGSLKEAVASEREVKAGADGRPQWKEKLKRAEKLLKARAMWKLCGEKNIGILTPASPAYPAELAQIYDPPSALYYQGDLSIFHKPAAAMVGSRRCSGYGAQTAEAIACRLAAGGLTIVSGMARGIDRFSHEGALKAGGATIAVLGCGVDVCYPPEHRQLHRKIAERGMLLSEFPPGTEAKPAHFPMRNRIISGLSKLVILVEAGEKSGSLITADYALEQGREVYCVPGSFFSADNRGGHRLLQQGAALLGGPEDVEELCGRENARYKEEKKEEHWLLEAVSDFGCTPETLCRETGRSPEVIQQTLTLLQIEGRIRIGPDGRIMKVQEL